MTCCWKISFAEFPEISSTERWSSFGILWVSWWLLCTEVSLPDQALRKKDLGKALRSFLYERAQKWEFFFKIPAQGKNMRLMGTVWGEMFYRAGVRATPHFRIVVRQKSTTKHSLTRVHVRLTGSLQTQWSPDYCKYEFYARFKIEVSLLFRRTKVISDLL